MNSSEEQQNEKTRPSNKDLNIANYVGSAIGDLGLGISLFILLGGIGGCVACHYSKKDAPPQYQNSIQKTENTLAPTPEQEKYRAATATPYDSSIPIK